MSCPNINLEEWKLLVASRGEDVAYALWDLYDGNVPESESKQEIVKSGLKATNILQSPKADQFFNTVTKNKISGDFFWKKMQADLGIPKDQMEILKSFDTQDRGELISSLLANYSYAIEINTAKTNINSGGAAVQELDDLYIPSLRETFYFSYRDGWFKEDRNQDRIIATKEELQIIEEYKNKDAKENSSFYSNLTVPGGTNYTENEIATPAITPSIKGHAQFATDQGIGWFRSDDKVSENVQVENQYEYYDYEAGEERAGNAIGDTRNDVIIPKDKFTYNGDTYERREPLFDEEDFGTISYFKNNKAITGKEFGEAFDAIGQPTKTRRILEVQSDLFQKGRDTNFLVSKSIVNQKDRQIAEDLYGRSNEENKELYTEREQIIQRLLNGNENKFLQLLNQGSNWVTFFVKSIIQDSAKKGYEKVLFPSGDTASKVEGHTTLEEFKAQKLARLKVLEEGVKIIKNPVYEKAGETMWTFQLENGRIENNFETKEEAENYLKEDNPYKIELEQLKQELERVEGPEGFGALKPIYNFYENTVTNVLNKQYGKENVNQVTDEYGNTWNEVVIVAEREQAPILLQTDEMPASKASEETVSKIKELAKQTGINIQNLVDYAKANPNINTKNVNGLADIFKGIIAIAQGKESEALTEEYVHIATAIIEETSPQLITALISKIDRFKIYKQTLEAYKNKKDYQLPNGKPDIRKIKKEAVDKLITELIINQSEGSTEFPELMQEEIRSMIREWWDSILDFFKGIYSKSNIELFETIAEQVAAGQLGGDVSSITKDGGVFFQQRVAHPIVDAAYTLQKSRNDRLIVIPEVRDASGKLVKKRHYLLDGKDEVEQTVTEKHKNDKKFKPKTEVDEKNNLIKMNFGIAGHKFIQDYINENLIDEDGYAKQNPTDEGIDTDVPLVMQTALKIFARDLIASYKPGTRFLIECKVFNEKEKGMLASTVDFKAFEPIEINGKPDMRVDTLDWKFTSLGTDKEDLPFWNIESWPKQMGEYVKMDRNVGITTNQSRKSRMVPFIVSWKYNVPGIAASGIKPDELEVGNVDPKKETKTYLIPVPIAKESTENKKVDTLVRAFRNQYEKIRKSKFGKSIQEKNAFLNQLSTAIRQLQVQLNFEPIAIIGRQFLDNSARALKTFENINYNNLTAEEIENRLRDLVEFKSNATKFEKIHEDFLSVYDKKELDDKGKKVLTLLKDTAGRTSDMMNLIIKLEKDYVVHLAQKTKIGNKETSFNGEEMLAILRPEVEISGLAKTFLEGTKLSNRIINLASNLILKVRSLANQTISKAIDDFSPLIINLENEAKRKGKTAFQMIGEERNGILKLIKKLDQSYYDELNDAIKNENKQFFLDNMDVAEFKRLAEEMIKDGIVIINETIYSTDEEQNKIEIERKIKNLKNSLTIDSTDFNGYGNWDFNQIFKKTLKEEKFYSDKFKELKKSDAAFKVWSMFTDWNKRAHDMGYLNKEGMAFFPLMEATLLQKFANTSDKIKEGKDFFDDLYKVRVAEEVKFSKTDPDTNELINIIPKYFTRTDKAVHQLSTDLTKVASLYIKSLTDYETAKGLENTLLVLHSVEQSKGTIQTDNGEIVRDEQGDVLVDLDKNKSADLLMTIISDFLYGRSEDLNSLGNTIISSAARDTTKTEEDKGKREVNIKKGLESSNILIRSLAVGLSPLIAGANYFGQQMQAYINAGNLYRYDKDYFPNHNKIIAGNLSIIEKALINYLVPLNENIAEEKIRKLSKEQSYIKFLSTWSFSDAMMSTNSIPERALGLTSALSIIKNSILVDGKIVNIRQYLKEQDRKTKYTLSESERKTLEKTFETRVLELKNSDKALVNIAKIENDELVIPGVNKMELAELRVTMIENNRKLSGQMNRDDKAGFARDTIFKSFMMFKTWIPKQVSVRTMGIKYSNELNEWEVGRTRLFFQVWNHLGLKRVLEMNDIISGSEKGLAIMDEILKEKKEAYFRKTGQELEISEEEFYDLMRQELSNQVKELKLLLGILMLVFAVKAAEPPEDADDLTKNRYKYLLKFTHKISDELSFYYNPLSAESITKGSILPQLGLASKIATLGNALIKEGYYTATGDEKAADKTYPLKYTFNLAPVAYQFQRDLLPLMFPEAAKDMGIRVTPQSRQ